MKICIVNTYQRVGGAAIAAYRLVDALREHTERQVVDFFRFADDGTDRIESLTEAGDGSSLPGWRARETFYSELLLNGKTEEMIAHFSSSHPGIDLSRIQECLDADVVHLHWVSGFVDPNGLRNLHALGKQIVWTLHDERAFTGGCHYSGGCFLFRSACEACPQLHPSHWWLPPIQLRESLEALSEVPIRFVAPSRWLAQQAASSRLLGASNAGVDVVPYSLCLNTFRPAESTAEKRALRDRFGLPQEAVCVAAGSVNWAEKRKGGELLYSAFELMRSDAAIQSDGREVCFVLYGEEISEESRPGVKNVGFLRSEVEMAELLKCCDLYATMTKEDNLPNTVIEALACGTPVVATSVGGVVDMVFNDGNGLLVPRDDVPAMAAALREAVVDEGRRNRWAVEARRFAEETFAPRRQAAAYERIYDELAAGPGGRTGRDDEARDFAGGKVRQAGQGELAAVELMGAFDLVADLWAEARQKADEARKMQNTSAERTKDLQNELRKCREDLHRMRMNPVMRATSLCRRIAGRVKRRVFPVGKTS